MNLRIIITLIGFATGWFLFEEMIVAAVVFAFLGITVWLGHRKKQRSNLKLKRSVR